MAKAKQIAGIDCSAAAAEAIGPVLVTRLKEMCARREHALNWADPEGVHDMRVASRRLRGALSDFSPYLRKRKLADVVERLKSVTDALGEVRDQDVAIMGLQKLAVGAPEEAQTTLDHFINARERVRKDARRDLRIALARKTLKNIQDDFNQAIDSATLKLKKQKRDSKDAAETTYIDVARSIITQRLEELEKLSDGFYHPLNVKPLHKLRIAAKHLRYAIELFEQCLGPGAGMFAKRVARLQATLGDLHDADVWTEAFGKQLEIAKQEQAKDRVAGSLWLLSHFVRLHSKHLRSALTCWEEWEKIEFGRQLREFLAGESSNSNPV